MATHSSVLAWSIPWTEELIRLSPQGGKELDMTEVTQQAHILLYITSMKLVQPFPHQRVHYILGLANLADSPGDLSFIMERVNNVSQGSEPQFLPKVPGTISCDSHDFHLLVTWESENKVEAFSKLILSKYFPDRPRCEVQNRSLR